MSPAERCCTSTASNDDGVTRERHAHFFLELAEQAEPELQGANQPDWLDRLALEHDNFRVALLWTQRPANSETGLRLCAALFLFWYVRGLLNEFRKWLSAALERGSQNRSAHMAKVLNGLGNLTYAQADYKAASNYYEQGLSLSQEIGNKRGVAGVLSNLGNIARLQGDLARARNLYEQSLSLCREIGYEWGVGTALHNLSVVAWEQGDYGSARKLGQEVLLMRRERQDKASLASVLNSMGEFALAEHDYHAAHAFLEECLILSRELGDKIGIARVLYTLSEVVGDQGDYEGAHKFQTGSLRLRQELGSKRGIAQCLQGLAVAAKEQAEPGRLVRLLASADAICAEIGAILPPQSRSRYEPWLNLAREKLGPDAFSIAWEDGKALSLEDAVALALEVPASLMPDATLPPALSSLNITFLSEGVPEPGNDLTKREIEVLRLVTVGLSNPEIARHLTLSVLTIQTHLHTIFSKINVKTRAAAVRYVFEHNLN